MPIRTVPPSSGASAKTQKVSVSLPSDLTYEVRRRAGRGGFSGFVAGAVRRQLERENLDELLTEMEAVNGPVPPKLLEEVERLWPKSDARRL